MKTTKMNLANVKDKLTRSEMKNIMAGSGTGGWCSNDMTCQALWGSSCWCIYNTCVC